MRQKYSKHCHFFYSQYHWLRHSFQKWLSFSFGFWIKWFFERNLSFVLLQSWWFQHRWNVFSFFVFPQRFEQIEKLFAKDISRSFFPSFFFRRLTVVSPKLFISCMLFVYQGACFFFKLSVNFEKMLSLFGSSKKAFSCALLMQIEMLLFLFAELVIISFEFSL